MKAIIFLFLILTFSFNIDFVSAKTMGQCKKDYKKCKKKNPFGKKKCKKKRKKCEAKVRAAQANKPAKAPVKTAPATAVPPKNEPVKAVPVAPGTPTKTGPLPKGSPETLLKEMKSAFDQAKKTGSFADRAKFAAMVSERGKKRLMRGCREIDGLTDAKRAERAKEWKVPADELKQCKIESMVSMLIVNFDTFFYPLENKSAKKTVSIDNNQAEVVYVVQDGKHNEKLIYKFDNDGGQWKFYQLSIRDP